MKKLRVALIGCGVISDNHLWAIIENESAELVALCDIRRERAEAKLEKYGVSVPIYENYIEMLDREKPDVVHIATPHYLHAEMTIEALERDINVFLEKPMCINRGEIEKIINAEKKSKGKVCVCFQNRFNPATVRAKQLVKEDGGAIAAYGTIFWERNLEYYKQDRWRCTMAASGGGVMINQAIHTIDLLCYFLGIPKEICATKANHTLKGVIDVEDTCEGVIEFEGGIRGNFYATNAFKNYDAQTVLILTENHKIEIRNFELFVDGIKHDLEKDSASSHGKACYGNGHKYLIDSFYSSVFDGSPSPVTAESAQYSLRILLAAYDSNDRYIPV